MAAYAYQHLEDLWRSGNLNRLVKEYQQYKAEGMLDDNEIRAAQRLLIPSEQRISGLSLPEASKECFNDLQAHMLASREDIARILGLDMDRVVKILGGRNHSLKVFKILVEKLTELRTTALNAPNQAL